LICHISVAIARLKTGSMYTKVYDGKEYRRVLLRVMYECQEVKRSGVVRELPRVGVTEEGEVQVVRDIAGDVHVYAKSADDVLVHRKKTDKVAALSI